MMSERSCTEEGKSESNLYALNPISRRYVLKTSDVYLRLLKSGVVSDDLAMEALDMRKKEASRARQRGVAAAAASRRQTEPKPKPAEPTPKARQAPEAPHPKKLDPRAEARRRVVQVALDNQAALDGCLDDDELEERLRRLLRPAPSGRATHSRHRAACTESDDETDGTDY